MTRLAVRAVLVSTTIFGLAACEDGFNFGQTDTTTDGASPATLAASETGVQDVERPDIFSTTEAALWDGRPSLGGIWVAHPDVTTPERAIITNDTTGQRIAGALFRREREAPGPKIQLSSDAAAALNILAGAPTQVTIIAVRQEEVEIEQPDPVISEEEVGETAEDATDDEVLAAAAAATPDADTEEQAETERAPGGFFQRLFGRRSPAPEAAAAGATVAAATDTDTAESAAAPAVETQTLDPVAAGAAAAIARAEADDKPAPRPEREAAPSGLRNPFIQVGLFTEEANAFSARDNLRTAGIVPTVLEGSNDNGPFWRVVVGPVTTAEDQSELLAQIKSLGFSDAFLTSK